MFDSQRLPCPPCISTDGSIRRSEVCFPQRRRLAAPLSFPNSSWPDLLHSISLEVSQSSA